MKKRVFLAVLAVCAALSTGACAGENKTETDTKKTETTAEKETEEEADGTEDEAAAKEEETAENKEDTKKENKGSSGDTRLVSVKDIDKYIKIGEYKGIALDNTVQAVTDEVVEAQLEYELSNKMEEVTDKNAAVQEGDLVTIDYVGTKDGTAFDGGTANNYDLTVGSGGMIPGFEDGIIGMKKGETKEVPLTFPEDYSLSEELAGQDVIFKITVQNFRRAPELTDEWVAENSDFKTVDEYKKDFRAQLEESAKQYAEYQLYNNAWNAVLEASEMIEFPEEEINTCIAEYKKQVEVYAKQAGMELMDFVTSQGYTEESFEDECLQYAEYKVKQNLIIQAIMDAEGISLDDKECLEIQDEIIAAYGAKDLADLIDQYGQVMVDETIGLLRVERLIAENAEITEKIAEGDQVGVDGDADDTSADEDDSVGENDSADEDDSADKAASSDENAEEEE